MVGRASPLLRRGAAFAALLALLLAYYELRHLLTTPRLWIQAVVIACVVIPAVFALIWLALPLWSSRYMLPAALVLGAVALGCELAHFYRVSNFAKFGAYAALGFWFLRWFETAAWVVLVAVIIPWVDAYSVWRGPTKHILAHQQQLFGYFSFAFPIPGEHASAQLGLPDLMFFAVFLAASARFRLRPGWTWLAMTASFGTTMALVVAFDLTGLPALPLLSIAFLAPNADLLWRRLRGTRDGSVTP